MSPEEMRRCLQVGLDAVFAAGPIALEYFRRHIVVEDKRHGGHYDPVTEADRRVEALIRERLLEAFPDHGITGEEYGTSGGGSVYWSIDPIDGTRSFISGMPTWGILLGLVVADRPVVGIVHQPFTGETWYAAPGTGARLRIGDRDTPLQTRAQATLADAVIFSTDPTMFLPSGMLERYQRLASRCRLQRWGGDCYAFALVAQGTIDLMVDGSLMPYDILPLVPIIEGAGGVVTDLAGRTPLAGGTVIAAANPVLHAAALALMTDGHAA